MREREKVESWEGSFSKKKLWKEVGLRAPAWKRAEGSLFGRELKKEERPAHLLVRPILCFFLFHMFHGTYFHVPSIVVARSGWGLKPFKICSICSTHFKWKCTLHMSNLRFFFLIFHKSPLSTGENMCMHRAECGTFLQPLRTLLGVKTFRSQYVPWHSWNIPAGWWNIHGTCLLSWWNIFEKKKPS